MLKKLVALMVVIGLLGVLPLLAGCEKNTYKSHTESTETHSETHENVQP